MNPLDRHTLVRESKLKYLHDDFVLVEEVAADGSRLFPHTEQLPKILKAIEREFYEGLPAYYAKTDHRADERRRYVLLILARRFCDTINVFREDGLLLHSVLRRDRIARMAVVQRIEQSCANGVQHRFRLFVDGAFFPDIHLSGKRIAFTSHFLERYRERIAKMERMPFSMLFTFMYDSCGYVMRVNSRERAFVMRHQGKPEETIVALTFEESEDEFLFTTVLTVNEIRELEAVEPARILDSHHGRHFPAQVKYNIKGFIPQSKVIEIWKKKIPPDPVFLDIKKLGRHGNWDFVVRAILKGTEEAWHDDWHLCFSGNYHSTGHVYLTDEDLKTRPMFVPEDGP